MATATKKTTRKQAPAKKATKKKLSQLAAAEKVLATAKKPMNCRELVEAMAKKRLWSSPGGKTPEATLYAALLRHIRTKGKEARFRKVGPGQFALNR